MSRWPGNANRERTNFGGLSRSELMSRVRSSGNETTELRLAKLLKDAGLKGWRRHRPVLGNPDFVWPSHKIAVFVDGCFWHGHTCGSKNLNPKTNKDAWKKKIDGNKTRDNRITRKLQRQGWSVIRIWECDLSRKPDVSVRRIERTILKISAEQISKREVNTEE